jgi:hypothetical protein
LRRLTSGQLIWIAALIEAAILLHVWISAENVTISAVSSDKKLIGQIVAAREFPYLSVQGYLVVRDGRTGRTNKRNLLIVRDTFSDVVAEVHSLTWNGASITIDVDRSHYSGPSTFSSQ